jgi:hypothetical protein
MVTCDITFVMTLSVPSTQCNRFDLPGGCQCAQLASRRANGPAVITVMTAGVPPRTEHTRGSRYLTRPLKSWRVSSRRAATMMDA